MMIILLIIDESNITMLRGRNRMIARIKRLEVAVFSETVFLLVENPFRLSL